MTGNEIATALQYGANPIMIISDNSMYGTIGMHSYVRYPERPFMAGTRLTNPDFAQWAPLVRRRRHHHPRPRPRSPTASPAPLRSKPGRSSFTA